MIDVIWVVLPLPDGPHRWLGLSPALGDKLIDGGDHPDPPQHANRCFAERSVRSEGQPHDVLGLEVLEIEDGLEEGVAFLGGLKFVFHELYQAVLEVRLEEWHRHPNSIPVGFLNTAMR